MSEFGGLWKHENNQHALAPPKDGMRLPRPSGGGIKKRSHTYATVPLLYGGTQTKKGRGKKPQAKSGGKNRRTSYMRIRKQSHLKGFSVRVRSAIIFLPSSAIGEQLDYGREGGAGLGVAAREIIILLSYVNCDRQPLGVGWGGGRGG